MGKEPDKYTGTSSKCVCRRDERISRESRPGDETSYKTRECGSKLVSTKIMLHIVL